MNRLTTDVPPASEQPRGDRALHLKELVLRHEVCFESHPCRQISPDRELITTGYELDLIGTVDPSLGPVLPGGDAWRSVHRALLTIAREILPRNEGEFRCSIASCGVAFDFSPRRKMRRDIVIAIDITDRQAHFAEPVTDGALRCLHQMQATLVKLGARADRW